MTRRTFLAGSALATAATPPNIVLFISDDHGYFDSSVYGSSVVRTPALDRLAREGTVFTNVFGGSPTCVPSRAILMTGLMSARNGAEANHTRLRPDVKTLPSYLKGLGYRVAHFGKSHFQPRENYPDLEFVPSEIKGDGPLNNDLDVSAVDRWIAASSGKAPVALVVGCHSPHVYWPASQGYDPARVDLPPSFVDTPATREYRAQYYTDIGSMDRQLNSVYELVRKHLGQNTLFLYTTDNGAQWPFAKWSLYDAGIHLPMIGVWPGMLKAGARSAALISFSDVVPTLVEIAGGQAPPGLDGRSFAPVLRGKSERHRTEIYATHSGDGNMNVYPMRCLRDERFKYILNLHPEFEFTTHIDKGIDTDGVAYWRTWEEKARTDGLAAEVVKRYHIRPREEFYDTRTDPHEMKNLIAVAQHKPRIAAMRAKLEAWMAAQKDTRTVFGTPRPL